MAAATSWTVPRDPGSRGLQKTSRAAVPAPNAAATGPGRNPSRAEISISTLRSSRSPRLRLSSATSGSGTGREKQDQDPPGPGLDDPVSGSGAVLAQETRVWSFKMWSNEPVESWQVEWDADGQEQFRP